ncbi:hypothetical protein EPH95_05655 [Salicibibacter halophilus]|uniref:Uncharacterized protein n=1 Tax=Salicibibacter halophilus TaxID=2502791 RepID=A0A514LGQ8_9BACI|nr:hypothetical protein EPH95_05655 [Salicibibacter halophilus]
MLYISSSLFWSSPASSGSSSGSGPSSIPSSSTSSSKSSPPMSSSVSPFIPSSSGAPPLHAPKILNANIDDKKTYSTFLFILFSLLPCKIMPIK